MADYEELPVGTLVELMSVFYDRSGLIARIIPLGTWMEHPNCYRLEPVDHEEEDAIEEAGSSYGHLFEEGIDFLVLTDLEVIAFELENSGDHEVDLG